MSGYSKVGAFVNGSAPAINAAFLNGVEGGLAAAAPFGVNVRTVAGSGESADVKALCDYVCDGTADEVQINAALADVGAPRLNPDGAGAAYTSTKGQYGGTVVLIGRQFNIADSIKMRTYSKLWGLYGKDGTWIRPAATYTPGATRGCIELFDDDTQYTTVNEVSIDGLGRSVSGFRYQQDTGFEWDAYHVIKDSFVYNVGQVGIALINNSGGRLRGNHLAFIRVINSGSHGLHIGCPDSYYTHIDVGSPGGHGFYVNHANTRLVNCKAWFCDGDGFHMTSVGRDNQLSACESQDNQGHGYVVGAGRTTISACCADSNGYNGTSTPSLTGDGFYITANGFNIQGTSSEKRESTHGGVSHQRYGVNFATSGLKGILNVTTYQNATAPMNGTPHASSIVNVVDMG